MGWLARFWAGLVRAPGSGSSSAGPEQEGEESDTDGPSTGDPSGVVVMPIEDSIDLHHFSPRDVPSVVDEYLRAARSKGLSEVTVIHGRGKGVQRQVVQRIAARHPAVVDFAPAAGARALGATVIRLRPPRGRTGRR